MGLDTLVRSGIAVANKLTAKLQVPVSHEAWIGDTSNGPTFRAVVARQALFEKKQRLIRRPDGTEVQQQAMVTIIGPIAADGAANRREPIDPRDRITSPDGTTGPILDVKGLADPATGFPYMYEVALG